MTRPGTLYAWDTNGTNVLAPTSGHQSDGYAHDEVPSSKELNGLLANWSQELAYLDGQTHGTDSLAISIRDGKTTGGGASFTTSGGKTYFQAAIGSGGGLLTKEIVVPEGTITDISWYCFGSSGTEIQQVSLNSIAADGTTATVLAAFGGCTTSPTQYKMSTFVAQTGGTLTGSLPVTADGSHAFQIELTTSGVGTEIAWAACVVVTVDEG